MSNSNVVPSDIELSRRFPHIDGAYYALIRRKLSEGKDDTTIEKEVLSVQSNDNIAALSGT